MPARRANESGFSIIELLIVMVIIGVVSAIAVPRFADAGSGRRLSAASRTLVADIEHMKLIARSSSNTHIIKFYPEADMYIIVEGTDVQRESVVLVRDFSGSPFAIEIKRTSLGSDQFAVVDPLGNLAPGFTVGLMVNGFEKSFAVDGGSSTAITVSDSLTASEILSY